MAQYRKKPVVIDAVRWWTGGQEAAPDWFKAALEDGRVRFGVLTRALLIETLEGTMEALPGDWIIQGIEGEIYPCKDSIFRATYEDA